MFTTVQNVLNNARQMVGDPSGTAFTDNGSNNTVNLRILAQNAYAELWRALAQYDNPFLNRYFHVVLPKDQSYLNPVVQAQVKNIGEIQQVQWKRLISETPISGVSPNVVPPDVRCRVTATAHGRSTGDQVVILPQVVGIDEQILGEWTIRKVDDDSIDLMGCIASGVWASGGTVAYSPDLWGDPMVSVRGPLDLANVRHDEHYAYTWEADVFNFIPTDIDRLLKVSYSVSGELPANSSAIPFDDAGDFMSYRTASLAAQARGETSLYRELTAIALGPRMTINDPEGLLGELIDSGIKGLNKQLFQFGPYRERRNTSLPGTGAILYP